MRGVKPGFNGVDSFILRTRKVASGCILWMGCKQSMGYGMVTRDGEKWLTHRYAYALFVGPIPDGLEVMHSCDVPLCVNPSHLSPGTHRENMIDCIVTKGRRTAARGEGSAFAKLCEADIVEIRRLRSNRLSFRKIALLFNVSHQNVRDIAQGRAWKHVPEKPL